MHAEPPAEPAEAPWDPFGAAEPEHVTPEPSPWDAAPEESAAAGDTMSPFAPPEPPPAPPESPTAMAEPSPWDEQPSFEGETRAFPRMSFEELQQMTAAPTPEPEPPSPPPAAPEPSPWDEPAPITGGETRAFPKMSFEELQAMTASAPAEDLSPWSEEPASSPFEGEVPETPPVWTPSEEPAPAEESVASESFATEVAAPFADSLAQQEAPFEPEMTAVPLATEEPAWTPSEPEPLADNFVPAATTGDLTDDQIDRIARRVVQLMSEQVVRNIAWEVIPDLAEIVVKERIRQLESEA